MSGRDKCEKCGTLGADCLTAEPKRVCETCLCEHVMRERDELRRANMSLYAQLAEVTRQADEMRREVAIARSVVGRAWFAGDVSLAEAITRKCSMLEKLGTSGADHDGERS